MIHARIGTRASRERRHIDDGSYLDDVVTVPEYDDDAAKGDATDRLTVPMTRCRTNSLPNLVAREH